MGFLRRARRLTRTLFGCIVAIGLIHAVAAHGDDDRHPASSTTTKPSVVTPKALFAGQLAGSYAPELALSGVAAIAPATELAELLRDDLSTEGGPVLASYSLWAWSNFYGISIETAGRSLIRQAARAAW